MEAGAAAATQATTASRTKTKTIKPDQAGTPWWMWLAVAAIVVFCLFPFYWLLNISLKTVNGSVRLERATPAGAPSPTGAGGAT